MRRADLADYEWHKQSRSRNAPVVRPGWYCTIGYPNETESHSPDGGAVPVTSPTCPSDLGGEALCLRHLPLALGKKTT